MKSARRQALGADIKGNDHFLMGGKPVIDLPIDESILTLFLYFFFSLSRVIRMGI